MTLFDLLSVLDPLAHLIIWHPDTVNDGEDEPTYEGAAMDTPYWLLNFRICKNNENDGDGGVRDTIYNRIYANGSTGRASAIIIVLTNEEKEIH